MLEKVKAVQEEFEQSFKINIDFFELTIRFTSFIIYFCYSVHECIFFANNFFSMCF